MKKFGIALGGGGARGLAHIVMLEVLDELDIKPHAMAGTSIGAVIGVLYAGGLSGTEIREEIKNLTSLPESFEKAFKERRLFGWLDFIDLEFGRNSVFKTDKFIDQIEEAIGVSQLEELEIPLKVVATDFWNHKEVVLDTGPIEEAVSASFAIPGIFKPIVRDGQVLVDGGIVNPVPYDLLVGDCDVVIAIDVITPRKPRGELMPSYTDSIFNTFQIAAKTIVNQKLRHQPPTIYIEPKIDDVLALEFHKVSKIFAQAEPARKQLESELKRILE